MIVTARRRRRVGLWGGGALVVRLAVTITVVLTAASTPSGSHSEVPAPAEGVDEKELVHLAAGAEDASEHSIARAIADHGRDWLGTLPEVESFSARAGLGVEAVVDGDAVVVGRPSLLADWGVHLPDGLTAEVARLEAEGSTVVAIAADGERWVSSRLPTG